MHIFKDKTLVFIIIAGVILRLVLAVKPGFKIDVDAWFTWAIRLSHFNFSQFYSKDVFTDYTPGYLYVLSLLGYLKNLLGLHDAFFYFLLKVPAIISELVIGLIIYQESKNKFSRKLALIAAAFILFNPALIFNSSIWGQIDSVLALLMLIAVITLKQNNLILSSIFFALALLVKPQAIALMPLFIIFLITNLRLSTLLKLSVPGLLTVLILSFPFFPNQTLISLIQHISSTAKEYPYTSLFAYNFWGAIGFWIKDGQLWNGISYQTWSYILLASFWLIIVIFYHKKKLSLYSLAALATLGFFFLPTRVHERYLYPTLVFLILLAATYRSKFLLASFLVLSFLHFFNLYYVYVYYNEIYLKLPKIVYNPLIYNFLDGNNKGLSLVSTIVFIFISISIIKYNVITKKD